VMLCFTNFLFPLVNLQHHFFIILSFFLNFKQVQRMIAHFAPKFFNNLQQQLNFFFSNE